MSAPVGWDAKSWADVCLCREEAQAILLSIRQEEGKEEPSPARMRALFADLAANAQAGELAAAWCDE